MLCTSLRVGLIWHENRSSGEESRLFLLASLWLVKEGGEGKERKGLSAGERERGIEGEGERERGRERGRERLLFISLFLWAVVVVFVQARLVYPDPCPLLRPSHAIGSEIVEMTFKQFFFYTPPLLPKHTHTHTHSRSHSLGHIWSWAIYQNG